MTTIESAPAEAGELIVRGSAGANYEYFGTHFLICHNTFNAAPVVPTAAEALEFFK